MDVGIYPISLLAWAFGHREPTEVKAMAVMHPGGTPDVAGSVQLRCVSAQHTHSISPSVFPSGSRFAVLASPCRAQTVQH